MTRRDGLNETGTIQLYLKRVTGGYQIYYKTLRRSRGLGLYLGRVCVDLRDFEGLQRALDISQEICDRRNEALQSWNLGLLYKESDPGRAVALMSVCVAYEREIGHPGAPGGRGIEHGWGGWHGWGGPEAGRWHATRRPGGPHDVGE